MAAILYLNGSERLGKEKNFQGDSLALPLSPPPTIHSSSKSNMVGWTNNGELVMLAQPYKMPAVQANTM